MPRLTIGVDDGALEAAEQSLGALCDGALAIAVGHSHVLSVARSGAPFSAVERDLLEHLAAQAAVSLENLRLEELMRRTEAELRAILEGVADAVAAEDPDGRLVYVNAAAARLLDGADELGTWLGIPPDALPGRRVLNGATAEPLVVRHPGEPRWSRVKASPVLEDGGARLAISVIEDITEIKQAEESQRFLAESSRALAGSLELEETLPAVARLVAGNLADACAIHLLEAGELRLVAYAGRRGPGRRVAGGGDPGPRRHRGADHAARRPRRRRHRRGPGAARRRGDRQRAPVPHPRGDRARRSSSRCCRPSCRRSAGVETAALFRPVGEGNEVGGDFYDLFSTGEREWFAVMGDVCGKGAEAASVTALARYTIRAAVPRHRSPAGILRWLNDAMLRQRAGRFVTIAIARLQLELDGTVTATVVLRRPSEPADPARHRAGRGARRARARCSACCAEVELVRPQRAPRARRRARALHRRADRGQRAATCGRRRTSTRSSRARAGATRQGIVEHLAAVAAAEAEGPLRDDLALLALTRSALAVGIDVDVVDLPLAARARS